MKLIDFREDKHEKSYRIGFATIEIDVIFGKNAIPLILQYVAVHESVTAKGTRRWCSFRTIKTDKTDEKGFNIFDPLIKFKESHLHGEFSSWLWKQVEEWRLNAQKGTQEALSQTYWVKPQENTKTQPMPSYGGYQQFEKIPPTFEGQANVPF